MFKIAELILELHDSPELNVHQRPNDVFVSHVKMCFNHEKIQLKDRLIFATVIWKLCVLVLKF